MRFVNRCIGTQNRSIFNLSCPRHCFSLSLVLACSCSPKNLRARACRVLPKGGRGLSFAPIRGLVMGSGRWLGCRFGRGVHWGIHLHGGGVVGSFGLGLRGLLGLRLGFRLSWLGGRLGLRVRVRFGVRLLFGLGGLLTCSCSVLLLPRGHCCSMTGIQQMPLNPKHLLLTWVFHAHSPPRPPPPHNRGYNPRVETIGVGHIHLFTKHGVR